MPKFLLGRVNIYVTQVEAESEHEAIQKLNANNSREMGLKGDEDVGETYEYKKAWVEPEGSKPQDRVIIMRELGQLLNNINSDGSERRIISPFNGQIGSRSRPLGS